MKKSILFIISLTIATFSPLFAQNLSINNTDASEFPKIKINISINEKTEIQQSDFKVIENEKELIFTLNKQTGENSSTAICFLIEASGNTYGTPSENFKKAISNILDGIGENNQVNICYFGKANSEGRSLNTISAEFTNDFATLKSELKSKVSAPRDTQYISDVFKSIYECLDFINSKKDLPENKILIVLSAAINNSRSPIKAEDCIDKANKFNIPVYTLTYKTGNRYAADNFVRISDQTNGKSQSVKSEAEISDAITNFLDESVQNASSEAASFIIEFTTEQTEEKNTVEIKYKNETISAEFAAPDNKTDFIWNKKWVIVTIPVGIIILLVIIVLLMSGSKKKKKEESEKIRLQQEHNMRINEQQAKYNESKTKVSIKEPQKFDLKRTIISSGGGTPMIMVTAGNFSQNFPLNKNSLSIGRGTTNDIIIPESTVSGIHATINNEGGNWFIIDNNSTNGTFVNGAKITRQMITPNDSIKLGAAFIKFQH